MCCIHMTEDLAKTEKRKKEGTYAWHHVGEPWEHR